MVVRVKDMSGPLTGIFGELNEVALPTFLPFGRSGSELAERLTGFPLLTEGVFPEGRPTVLGSQPSSL